MRLVRVADNGVATYGVLVIGDTPFALALERAWRNNERGDSCIPPAPGGIAVYQCARVESAKFGSTFEVLNVRGRSEILFHKGNIDDDSHGCILVGEAFNPVLGRPGITDSGHGFAELMNLMKLTDRFQLEIDARICHVAALPVAKAAARSRA